MPGEYDGKRAMVVGGTHGIGLAVGRQLVDGGARVVVAGRDGGNVASAGELLGRAATALRADVTSLDDIRELRRHAVEELGSLDALFLNAAVAELAPFEDVTEESFDRQFAINVKGAFFAAQTLAPLVERGGGIVFTTVTASTASPGMAVYNASKAALRTLAHTLAAELVADGVRVNTVAPGFTDTPTLGVASASAAERAELHAVGDAITPMGRHGTADEVAAAAIFMALGATFSTGTELQVDGGLSGIDAPVAQEVVPAA